jgi:hypothetical protein
VHLRGASFIPKPYQEETIVRSLQADAEPSSH